MLKDKKSQEISFMFFGHCRQLSLTETSSHAKLDRTSDKIIDRFDRFAKTSSGESEVKAYSKQCYKCLSHIGCHVKFHVQNAQGKLLSLKFADISTNI